MKKAARWSVDDVKRVQSKIKTAVGTDSDSPQKPGIGKHGSKITVVDGIRFHSAKESRRYIFLMLAKRAGEVLWFTRQVPFWLPGGTRWYCDFLVAWRDGSITIEDVKSAHTRTLETYRVKKREIEALHGFKIQEV